jgi:glycosyltransferase involved in cell wall biosynthesis
MSFTFINQSLETFTPTESGAIATVIWECCQAAKRASAAPWVVTRNCAAAPYEWEKTVLVDYPPTPTSKLGVFLCRAERKLDGWRHMRQRAYAHRVARAIREKGLHESPLILHNDPEMAVFLRGRFPGTPIIHHFHNQHDCKAGFRARFGKSVTAVTAVSDFIARWAEGFYGLEKGSVKTIYNGVDAERFSPGSEGQDGPPVLSFVGRTGVEKAPDLLLKAAKKLAAKTREFSVQLVGSNHWGRFVPDDYQRQLQALAEELSGAGIAVRTPGFVTRPGMPAEFRKAHIHVVPSRWDEPCALTLFEGMASGLALVASKTGGTPEVVGEAGLLFERDSVDGLADCLERLVMDRGLRREYGRAARKRSEQFTWDATVVGMRAAAGV